MKIKQVGPLRASKELLAYIRKHHGSVPKFCESSGLDRIKVQKAIRGEWPRLDVDFAFGVQDATAGHVRAEWWRTRLKSSRKAA